MYVQIKIIILGCKEKSVLQNTITWYLHNSCSTTTRVHGHGYLAAHCVWTCCKLYNMCHKIVHDMYVCMYVCVHIYIHTCSIHLYHTTLFVL